MIPDKQICPSPIPFGQSEQAVSYALTLKDINLSLQGNEILKNLSFNLSSTRISCVIGPSGAGKSSLLHCINGLLSHWQGDIQFNNVNTKYWPGGWDLLRREIGLIGQKPCVFPCSIKNNVIFGVQGFMNRRQSKRKIEAALRQVVLWDEVKNRLHESAERLSIGQQQRLCLARTLIIKPKLLLLDEPTASLDEKSTQLIEQFLKELSNTLPILWISHDLAQTRRVSEKILFMCDGRIIEQASTKQFFDKPLRIESREFIQWNMCDCD